MSGPLRRPLQQRRLPWVQGLLALLALLDLRVELQLLLDHFTWSSLMQIPVHHPLAMAVLLLVPCLQQRPR
jgi:hypothetical protein